MASRRTITSGPKPTLSSRAGLTLIETLLAVAITALIIGLIYSIYHTTLTVVSDQQTRIAGPIAAMTALNSISRDLACSLKTEEEVSDMYSLLAPSRENGSSSELSCFTAVRNANDELSWYDIERVTFRVPKEGPLEQSLVRESQLIVGPASQLPPVTNVLIENVTSFRAQFFDGNEWVEEWPSDGSPEEPKAARLTIELEHKKTQKLFETEVFIPVGNVITSSLERIAIGG